MSSLPFSRYSLEPDGNVYHRVDVQRFAFVGPVKVTIEGEDENGDQVEVVFNRVKTNDTRNGVAYAVVTRDPEIRHTPDGLGAYVEQHHRLIIDSEAESLQDVIFRVSHNPPKYRVLKHDYGTARPRSVRDLTHQAKVQRVKASKSHSCDRLGCPGAIEAGDTYLKVTDLSRIIRRVGGHRPVYDVKDYHDGCHPTNLRYVTDLVMGRP